MNNSPVPIIPGSNISRRTRSGWLNNAAAVMLLLAVPLLVHGQVDNPASQATVKWHALGEVPTDTRGAGQQQNQSMVGSFVGVHNGGLIVAGGAHKPTPQTQQSADDQPNSIYSNTIWVATRGSGSDRNGDGEITPDERSLSWHDTQVTLPGNRSYGASASHHLGLIAIGGTDGEAALSDAVLIRWDETKKRASLLVLPPMPDKSVDGGAAVIGDTVFVVVGNNGAGPTGEVYALDLSRIQTDVTGEPIADGNTVRIIVEQDEQGRLIPPWHRLPALPQLDGATLTPSRPMVVAQYDGRGERLYVISRRSISGSGGDLTGTQAKGGEQQNPRHEYSAVWAYDPHADGSATAWTRKADVSVDGQPAGLSGGAVTALGQSHILIMADPDSKVQRKALSYNAITDAWTDYSEVSLTPRPRMGAIALEVNASATTTSAVRWGGDTILVRNDMHARKGSSRIWAIQVRGPKSSFGWQNMTVLVVYMLSMVLVGVYFAFRNKDTDDYFRGGQHIPWWAAACSIYATMMSSLSFVALPALIYGTDWLMYMGVIGLLIVTPIAVYIALPFFRQIDAISAYEYLSKRFNMPVRLVASGLFTLFHVGRMGIVLALTALALAAVTPLDAWQSVLIMGVLSLIYSTLGGIEAVIWTDTIQTFVLLIGALICFGFIVAGIDGGFSGLIDSGMTDNKFRMVDLDFGPGSITSLSIWVIVLGGIGQNLSSYTADQAVVQRYMTTRDTRAAAKSIWANGLIQLPFGMLFFFIGTGLYSYYQSQPGKLDPTIQIDQIFPTFIGTELPIGIAGLIVAAIFAAAQSTVSTSMNSMATTLVTDFMRPFNACRSERSYLTAARLLTVLMGILGTATGLLFISPEIRSLLEEYFKVIGMFMGALGGLFVLGVATRRANGWGALVGLFTSVAIMVTVWLNEWANGYLFATIGILSVLLIGYLASLLLPSDHRDLDGLTIYTMHRKLSIDSMSPQYPAQALQSGGSPQNPVQYDENR